MVSQFIVPSFLLLLIMASPLPAGLHSLPMYSTPARHRSVEEEDMPRVPAPLTNTPHILELLPMNASSLSPETPSRTSSPGIYVPNTDSTTVLGKRGNPTDEPSPSPTGSRSQSPELYLPQHGPHLTSTPALLYITDSGTAISNLGAGSSRSVDTTTAAYSLPTPEDLFHSLRPLVPLAQHPFLVS
ncbi:hypothetical protein C8R44DRAFT_987068 [Mycena epipterygia]|nr:hypothetical protein C8R44DRAFT_987068 [Mycena epipterygia]